VLMMQGIGTVGFVRCGCFSLWLSTVPSPTSPLLPWYPHVIHSR
jgi:hypothetical protein